MTRHASLAGGRRLAYDDVGDPDGVPVVYLHGCPDCRLTRHPDDAVAADLGIRLIAVDRPGYGESSPPVAPTLSSVATDVNSLVETLDIAGCGLFAWSSGAMVALAMAEARRDLVGGLAIAAGTLPTPGPDDDESVSEIVSLLVPDPLTIELAREVVRENKSAVYLHDLDSVPGLEERLANAMVAAMANGSSGAAFDVRTACTPLPVDLASVDVPVTLWYGEKDDVVPMSAGEHLVSTLPRAELHAIPDASHLIALTHWTTILDSLRRDLTCP